jgi:hypothetical protein
MEPLKIKPTINSLEVSLDAETGKMLFSGRSYPENSVGFFNPVIEWMENYALHPAEKTEFTFRIEYFNSASRKNVIQLFKILESIHKNAHPVTVIWDFEEGDDSMKETGEEYQNLFRLDFKFCSH